MEPTRIRVRHSAVVANDDQPDMNRTTPPRRFSSSRRQAIVTTTTPNKGMSFPSPIGTPTHTGRGNRGNGYGHAAAASPLSPCLWWMAFEEGREARVELSAAEAAADATDPSRNGWPLGRR